MHTATAALRGQFIVPRSSASRRRKSTLVMPQQLDPIFSAVAKTQIGDPIAPLFDHLAHQSSKTLVAQSSIGDAGPQKHSCLARNAEHHLRARGQECPHQRRTRGCRYQWRSQAWSPPANIHPHRRCAQILCLHRHHRISTNPPPPLDSSGPPCEPTPQ